MLLKRFQFISPGVIWTFDFGVAHNKIPIEFKAKTKGWKGSSQDNNYPIPESNRLDSRIQQSKNTVPKWALKIYYRMLLGKNSWR